MLSAANAASASCLLRNCDRSEAGCTQTAAPTVSVRRCAISAHLPRSTRYTASISAACPSKFGFPSSADTAAKLLKPSGYTASAPSSPAARSCGTAQTALPGLWNKFCCKIAPQLGASSPGAIPTNAGVERRPSAFSSTSTPLALSSAMHTLRAVAPISKPTTGNCSLPCTLCAAPNPPASPVASSASVSRMPMASSPSLPTSSTSASGSGSPFFHRRSMRSFASRRRCARIRYCTTWTVTYKPAPRTTGQISRFAVPCSHCSRRRGHVCRTTSARSDALRSIDPLLLPSAFLSVARTGEQAPCLGCEI
mmetsp:Transcript_5069/g.20246  ORF Transcript_5069/g.20246 Transcript_5069/m.20246 type:complete len:309 (-) Transcript_5069:32-958(-)